jgi:hypothetical protein
LAACLLASGSIAGAADWSLAQWSAALPASGSGSTHLVELRQGGEFSRRMASMRLGGYETAQGQQVDFARWYTTRWADTHVGWMTQIDPNWGFLWGFGTGEQAPKYRISPSLKLGLLFTTRPTRDSHFSFRWTTTLGGHLQERACTADYGAIGGVQQVNCRLAASTLAPADTLQYLVRESSRERRTLSVEYRLQF